MSEKPIIFSGPMVRAILDGRKTQTRRVVNRFRRFGPVTEFGKSTTSGYDWHFRDRRLRWNDFRHDDLMKCAPYKPGDTLWVRETFNLNHYQFMDGRLPKERPEELRHDHFSYQATEDDPEVNHLMKWRPSIFMPRWACRINLRVTNVRVERLQDISEEDAIAEGCTAHGPGLCTENPDDYFGCWSAKTAFRKLWDSINANRALWDDNPWVWVIEFERDAEGES